MLVRLTGSEIVVIVSYPRERVSEFVVLTLCANCHNLGSGGSLVRILDCAATTTGNIFFIHFESQV